SKLAYRRRPSVTSSSVPRTTSNPLVSFAARVQRNPSSGTDRNKTRSCSEKLLSGNTADLGQHRLRVGRGELLGLRGVVHGAELRSAHGAERCVLETLLRQRFVVVRLRRFRVERQSELLFPVECETGARKSIVAIACARPMTGDIGGMRGDFIGDQALLHVL